MFKPSLRVGSTFLEIISRGADEDSDIIYMETTESNLSGRNSNGQIDYHTGCLTLNNITDSTVVAFHLSTNYARSKDKLYKITPKQGFLVPNGSVKIRVDYYDYTLDDPSDIQDIIFIKAMPLDENQINTGNIEEFSFSNCVFNPYNIDLMFTINMLTTEFVDYKILSPPPKEKPNRVFRKSVSRNERNYSDTL